eukprot:CAMPEP_0202897236 /NCGR_PEP_ID=MMETSP1392-20130828/6048_1 /ASSEMBLY_ACC=CAM_ASM_000868 /TAXON_ID=225041 /ORGANISM="Chlamydomonas chlamydogama, Strain SAG 11-48b" /LENGTH=501 /DNA_ID=CAMNT_0049582823 /DNA_START=206 /DNA_END=1711 /DNA_ORIENTATION=+
MQLIHGWSCYPSLGRDKVTVAKLLRIVKGPPVARPCELALHRVRNPEKIALHVVRSSEESCGCGTEAPAQAAAGAAVVDNPNLPPAAAKKRAPGPDPASNSANATLQHWQIALKDLENKNGKLVVCQVAPAVRVSIGEAFGLAPGALTTGKLVTGLKMLGFDYVFDTLFSADLTIMEEGYELLHRLTAHLDGKPAADEPMPMFTSCCPGWVAMVEKSYPDLIPYLSTAKSPQMMMGSVIKNFFADEVQKKPEEITMVSVMPCVRKQGEADREWYTSAGARDVDHVITTVELAKIFQDRGIKLEELEDSEFDDPLGVGSGGGLLFGTTGGVMEAALRTVYEAVTGAPMGRVVFEEVRGMDGIKEATINIKPTEGAAFKKYDPTGEGLNLRIAVANGLGNAKKLITNMKAGTAHYDFVEVMACPAGCIGGGGQPRSTDKQILGKRQQAMYAIDERLTIRRPHDNPFIQRLYSKWLGEPLSHKAHDMLHTHFVAGGPENEKGAE